MIFITLSLLIVVFILQELSLVSKHSCAQTLYIVARTLQNEIYEVTVSEIVCFDVVKA